MYEPTEKWTGYDIRTLRAEELPKADLWCFGFPCQDISVAGRQKGINGERSGLFYKVIELLKSQSTENKPEWLLVENVKNLLSIDEGRGFTEVLYQISKAGYDCEWAVLNSKDFGVPQNRERVFIIGHFREKGFRQILLKAGTSRQTDSTSDLKTKQIIAGQQAFRVYDSDGLSITIKAEGGGVGAKTGLYAVPKINAVIQGKHSQDLVLQENSISRSLMSRDYKGAQNVAIPCLAPDRINKRQNGRRFKEADDPMFTLTAQDRHGVFIQNGEEYYIRRLTPRECFRLQGFTDDQFDKAQAVNSDSQLYKQAGNAVTVNVAYYLGLLLRKSENEILE